MPAAPPRFDVRVAPFALLTLILSCGEGGRIPTALVAAPSAPQSDILDAAHGGNPYFRFLPPIGALPAPIVAHPGDSAFDATIAPEVRVCAWDGARCGAVVADFHRGTGGVNDVIHVSPELQAFRVLWQTAPSGLATGGVYRLRVLVAGTELGLADLAVVASQNEARGVDVTRYVPVVNGQPLQVAFRIAKGAVFIAPPDGGTLVTNGGAATLTVPAGAVNDSTGLTVLSAANPPSNPRYVSGTAFDFGPAGTTFASPVTVALRYDPSAVPTGSQRVLRLVQVVGSQLVPVPGSTVDSVHHVVTGAVSHFSSYAAAAVPVASVNVTPTSATFAPGAADTFQVTVLDPQGNVLTDRAIVPQTSPSGIVTTSVPPATQTVVATAVTPGSTTLTVMADTATSNPVSVTVSNPGPARITIQRSGPDQYPPEIGAVIQYSATVYDGSGAPMPGEVVAWQLQAPGGAAVVQGITGNVITVQCVTSGSFDLMATDGAATAQLMDLVNFQTIQQLHITPAANAMAVQDRNTFSAVGYDIRGNVVPIVSSTWSVNGASVVATATGGAGGNYIALLGTSQGSASLGVTVMAQGGGMYGNSQFPVYVGPEQGCGPSIPPCPGSLIDHITGVPVVLELHVGQPASFTASAVDATGAVITQVLPSALLLSTAVASYSFAGNNGVATVTVTGVSPGRTVLQIVGAWITYSVPVVVVP